MAAIDYPAVKTAVETWVANVAGSYLAQDDNGDPYIFWEEDAHQYVLAPYAMLSLKDSGSQGQDHLSWTYDAGTETVSPVVRGNRQVMIGIEIRSRETVNPRAAIEDLRTSLYNDLYLQQLQDDGALAFVRIDTAQHGIGIIYEDRKESLAILEITFGVHARLADATQTTESIERAGLTNEISDPPDSEVLVGEGAEP